MPRRPRIAPGGLVYHALNRAVARLPLFQKDGDYAAFLEVMHGARKGDAVLLLRTHVAFGRFLAMPRRPRIAPGGLVYHALNRAVARLPLFQKDGDYAAFLEVMHEAMERHPVRLLSFCLMPNHWHMVLWPRRDGELTAFLRWLTHTHTMRWHAHYHSAGTGHLYQGRFKAFPVETDDYLYTVLRYVERNALRANLTDRAERWRWGSLGIRTSGDARTKSLLHPWPIPMPRNWVHHVNGVETEAEVKALRRAVIRGTPFGSEAWQERTARRLGLQYTLRPRGRPKKTDASHAK